MTSQRTAALVAAALVVCAMLAPSAQTFERLPVVAGRSRVLTTSFDVIRIAVTNPAIADAAVVAPREILIDGKAPGTISLIIWGAEQRLQFDIDVQPAVSALQQQLRTIFPGEEIFVNASEEAIVLSGRVTANEVALRAEEIAQASAAKAKIINLLQKPNASDLKQVMLAVRFAEVEHNALTELGASYLANRPDASGIVSTQQFGNPIIDDSRPAPIVINDYLNVFFFLKNDGLLALVKALKQRGLFQSLAEPNLIAYNGQEASFLAGGEIPVPIVQGNSGQVSIQYKEFGVRLNFTPKISGELIRLKVRPEVSSIDNTNGIVLSGFRVPALKTRRAETDVELRDGQSFAIAGLMDNQTVEDHQMIPLLGNIPVIGNLFKSKSDTSAKTELLVLITPHLVRPLEPSEVPPLPGVKPAAPVKPGDGLGGALEGGGGLADAPAPQNAPGPTAAKTRKPGGGSEE